MVRCYVHIHTLYEPNLLNPSCSEKMCSLEYSNNAYLRDISEKSVEKVLAVSNAVLVPDDDDY